MTSCPDEPELLALVDGDLEASRGDAVLDHLGDCADCRATIAHAEAALCYALGGLADQERTATPVTRSSPLSIRRLLPFAAAAALLVSIGLLAATRSGERKSLTTADADSGPDVGPSQVAVGTTLHPARPLTLDERLDALLAETRALAARQLDDADDVDYGAISALAAAESRTTLIGVEAGRASLAAVVSDFPGTDAAVRARAALDDLGDE